MSKLVFFCKSKSYVPPHAIMFDSKTKQVACDCVYFQHMGFCSHIDATLIAGERAMVEKEDRPIADKIMQKMKGKIEAPPDWKASWRRDLVWRGLSQPISNKKTSWYIGGKVTPDVCFTGSDPKNPKKSRAAYLKEAEAKGFRPNKHFNKHIDIVVAPNPLTNTNKANGAAECNIPIISYDEWAVLTSDGEFVEDASEIKMDSTLAEPNKAKAVDLNLSRFDSPILSDEEKEENERWINKLRLIGQVQILAEKIWKKNPDADVEGMIERILDDNLSEDENNEAAAKVLQKELDLLG